jgi:hypothetical protein
VGQGGVGLGEIVHLNRQAKLNSPRITMGPYQTMILLITPTRR